MTQIFWYRSTLFDCSRDICARNLIFTSTVNGDAVGFAIKLLCLPDNKKIHNCFCFLTMINKWEILFILIIQQDGTFNKMFPSFSTWFLGHKWPMRKLTCFHFTSFLRNLQYTKSLDATKLFRHCSALNYGRDKFFFSYAPWVCLFVGRFTIFIIV